MQQFGNVFLFKGAIDKTRCEEFIHEQIVKPMTTSGVYGDQKTGIDEYTRSSEQCSINPSNPFCRDIAKTVRGVNDDFLNINVFDYCTENHFLKYEEGGKFIRHRDLIWDDTTVNHVSNTLRKISAICLLSDPETFEGGKFATYNGSARTSYKFEQGDLIIFPSYKMHQVDEVTSGIRYSSIHWSYGGF